MINDKGIEFMWTRYSASIFKGMTPSKVQRDETKKAFFAGAHGMFCILEALGAMDISDKQAYEVLDVVMAELQEFGANIKKTNAEKN